MTSLWGRSPFLSNCIIWLQLNQMCKQPLNECAILADMQTVVFKELLSSAMLVTLIWSFTLLVTLRSSHHSRMPYSFVISTWKSPNPAMDVASRVRDWRPPPPTPTKSALPKGCLTMRLIRRTCCAAYVKRTRCMGLLVCALNSFSPSWSIYKSLTWSGISSYLQSSNNWLASISSWCHTLLRTRLTHRRHLCVQLNLPSESTFWKLEQLRMYNGIKRRL